MMLGPRELRLHIADADLILTAPSAVLDVVDCMLADVSHTLAGTEVPLRVEVAFESELWRIHGTAPAGRKTLGRLSALPQVAGAVISSLVAELAFHRNFVVLRAAVVETDGCALALMGDDWESCVTIAAHLHTRNWRILGGDYALVAGGTFVVSAFKKALHANSSCIASFPTWYRRAIEASPWYSASQVIAFYAIDPRLVSEEMPWAERAPLRAIVKIDGRLTDHPSLETVDDYGFVRSVSRVELEAAGVEIASLVMGDFVETCDVLEQWFGALPAVGLKAHV